MGKNNTQLLKIAEKYLGQGGATFRKFCGLPSNAAWCNAFVCYIFYEGGDAKLYYGGKKVTYCPTSIKWCQANLAQIPIYLALPMDVIYFDWESNGIPNHIGFVRERKSDQEVYTIEGNTSGGIVAKKTRPVKYVCGCFRPHFVPTSFSATKKLDVDGYFGYNSIAVMQRWLKDCGCYTGAIDAILGRGTVKALQKKLGVAQDGSWGTKTSKALQKLVGTTVDGAFGSNSVKAFQKYLNKVVFPSKTNRDKIVDKAKQLAWPVGTAESKYAYKGGAPTAKFKTALNKIYPNRSSWGDAPKVGAACDVYTGVVVNSAGIGVSDYPRGLNEQIKYKNSKFTRLTYKNVTPYSVSQYGDVVMYYKKADGSSKHTVIRGDGVLYEAQLKLTYGHVNKAMKTKLNVKRPYVVILRAK